MTARASGYKVFLESPSGKTSAFQLMPEICSHNQGKSLLLGSNETGMLPLCLSDLSHQCHQLIILAEIEAVLYCELSSTAIASKSVTRLQLAQ